MLASRPGDKITASERGNESGVELNRFAVVDYPAAITGLTLLPTFPLRPLPQIFHLIRIYRL